MILRSTDALDFAIAKSIDLTLVDRFLFDGFRKSLGKYMEH